MLKWAFCQVSHGAIQFMVYEELKKATGSYNAWRSPGQSASDSAALASLQISLIGAASKLMATCATYPLQVGKNHRMHVCIRLGYPRAWAMLAAGCCSQCSRQVAS